MKAAWRRSSAQPAVARTTLLVACLVLLPGALMSVGCSAPVLDPQGPAAARIAEVWWVLFGVTTVIFIAVMIFFVFALRRAGRGDPEKRHRFARSLILWGGAIIPAIVVVGFMTHMVLTLRDLHEPPTQTRLTVHVMGHDWWWEIQYNEFETANEIHIPVGEPVSIHLTSHDVIHAFWVPSLQGKMDMLPESHSMIWLQADNPGTYDGFCAEFCGLQHARMHFIVVAEDREAVDEWLRQQAEPAQEPEDKVAREGAELFIQTGCGSCHSIAGTEAEGDVGPDLTHIASRQEIGAGTLQNSFDNLAAWIRDSQSYKPGNLMPSFNQLSDEQIDALTNYLEAID